MTEQAMTQEQAIEFGSLANELRAINSKLEKSSLDVEKATKMEARINELEEVNQKNVLRLEKEKNDAEELTLKLSKMEAALSIASSSEDKQQASKEMKQFDDFLRRKGTQQEREVSNAESWNRLEQKSILRTDFGPAAGYLVPEQYSNELLKEILEVSPIRSLCKNSRISSNVLKIPRRSGYTNATWKGETQTGDNSNPTYDLLELTADRLDTSVLVTREMLMDSAFNLEQEINETVTRDFSRKEGLAFLDGDGINKPYGLLDNSDVNLYVTPVSGVIDMADMINLPAQLKVGYDGVYIFNQRTSAYLRNITDDTGQFLWQPALADGTPATLNGKSYVIMPDMPDVALDSTPIMFGDFFKGYTVVDRMGMILIVDELTYKKDAEIEYTFQKWVGGQVVMPEALVKLQVLD